MRWLSPIFIFFAFKFKDLIKPRLWRSNHSQFPSFLSKLIFCVNARLGAPSLDPWRVYLIVRRGNGCFCWSSCRYGFLYIIFVPTDYEPTFLDLGPNNAQARCHHLQSLRVRCYLQGKIVLSQFPKEAATVKGSFVLYILHSSCLSH